MTRCPMCGQHANLIAGVSLAVDRRYRLQLELALREALAIAESAYEDQRTRDQPDLDPDLARLRAVLRPSVILDTAYAAGERAGTDRPQSAPPSADG